MSRIQEMINLLQTQHIRKWFSELYGDEESVLQDQIVRYRNLIERYGKQLPGGELSLFSTPGRTEIGGNHTDHNHGRVLAAAVHLDSIAVASRTNDSMITIYSEGYDDPFQIHLNDLKSKKGEKGTTAALIRGIASRFRELGYAIGGFHAVMSSEVMVGSGLSSSASVEVLIATILNVFYNHATIRPETLAQIGRFAENAYFGKPCGLMDQLTCAVGDIVMIDFHQVDVPKVKKIHFDLHTRHIRLLVVDTGGSHADLTEDYGSIQKEMISVAKLLGGQVLRDITFNHFQKHIPDIRTALGDRAVVRGLHYFSENQRVLDQVRALEKGDFQRFLDLVNASGDSSCQNLQNCYSLSHPTEQGISLALAMTKDFLRDCDLGAFRVHGGGFAGTIQVYLPDDAIDGYVRLMEPVFGQGSITVLNLRPCGTSHMKLDQGDSSD
ncbi:galactokinase [bacterium]|nr:galactokinase [bacterium]